MSMPQNGWKYNISFSKQERNDYLTDTETKYKYNTIL